MLSIEKQENQKIKIGLTKELQALTSEMLILRVAIEKLKNAEILLASERKINQSLQQELKSLRPELDDAIEFIEQQETRYHKSRDECLKLVQRVWELEDAQRL